MQSKTLKFRNHLAEMIMSGKKSSTWRLFDDKDITKGDVVELINRDTGEVFGNAQLVEVYTKTLGTLEDTDFDGHETFESNEEMYTTYREYYGDKVGPDTEVKIIRFKLI